MPRYDYRWHNAQGASERKIRVLSPQTKMNGMPRYFFDIHDGTELQRDTVGVQMGRLAQIRNEVMQALPAIARDEIPKNGDRQSFMIMVRGEDNSIIYTATLSFADLWTGDDPLHVPQPQKEQSV